MMWVKEVLLTLMVGILGGNPGNRWSDSRGVIHRVSNLSPVGECCLQVVSTMYFGKFSAVPLVEMPGYGWPCQNSILGRINATDRRSESFNPQPMKPLLDCLLLSLFNNL